MTSIETDAMTGNSMLRDVFPPHTYDQWREAVAKQLKGASFEKKPALIYEMLKMEISDGAYKE